MRSTPRLPFARPILVCLLAACSGGCGEKPSTSAEGSPPAASPGQGSGAATAAPAPAAASGSASSPASASAPAPSTAGKFTRPAARTLTPQLLTSPGITLDGHFVIDGALLVTAGLRVGRAVSNGVLWVGTIPAADPAYGTNRLQLVEGRWPDRVDAVYNYNFGPTLTPSFLPLKEKASSIPELSESDRVKDVINVGETTLVAVWRNNDSYDLLTVRGPELARKLQTPKEALCKEDEGLQPTWPAVTPQVMEASRAGTLVSIGDLCDKRDPAAEVWDSTGKSHIVDLSAWLKKEPPDELHRRQLLRGKGDELWYFPGQDRPILRYKDGSFELVKGPPKPVKNVFVSAAGDFYASDGRVIHRHDDGKWIPVAVLPWPETFGTMAMVDQGVIWGDRWRLRDNGGMEAREDCTTPFVYLSEVSPETVRDFTFPSIRKALSSFPGVSELSLVDFHGSDGHRKLGVTVTSNAQGEAVIAHVKTTLPDEDPLLLCYKPDDGRKSELRADEK
jgi:hypothetical protein